MAATLTSLRTPFWSNVRADIARFHEDGAGLRPVCRGILSQGFQALFIYRVFRWFYERHIPTQPFRFVFERFIEITTGICIPVQTQIGTGLRIHHFGGIIVHPESIIGDMCTIYHGVTLGDLGGRGGAPQVGDCVVIGAGAKLLGKIDIGAQSRIGANAVVVTSVPPGSTAVGIPAVVKKKNKKPVSGISSEVEF